ncbi:hemin transport protein HmuS [Klebsiella pneumoniae]|uniref:Hemin transport protein HmuS n=1 Tax=Klebsiella pneumoniae TaxID=573 RepID=A0A4P0YE78_KLEPN|nr:hemin transport protein HmuS [Klebsiella pneumoniae]
MAAWETLIAEYRVAGAGTADPAPAGAGEICRYRRRRRPLENDWRAMTDVHQFFGLLRKYQLSRQQAFRLVSDDLACRVDRHALPSLLETCARRGNEIMIFVGNRGCVQIFTGALEKLAPMRGWLNIFNTTFTLHLREESLDEVWVTRKPTSDGHVTSVELFAKTAPRLPSSTASAARGTPSRRNGASSRPPDP